MALGQRRTQSHPPLSLAHPTACPTYSDCDVWSKNVTGNRVPTPTRTTRVRHHEELHCLRGFDGEQESYLLLELLIIRCPALVFLSSWIFRPQVCAWSTIVHRTRACSVYTARRSPIELSICCYTPSTSKRLSLPTLPGGFESFSLLSPHSHPPKNQQTLACSKAPTIHQPSFYLSRLVDSLYLRSQHPHTSDNPLCRPDGTSFAGLPCETSGIPSD